MSNINEMPCVGRFGKVSVYDPKRHAARIEFPDKAGLVSNWLPVLTLNSLKNKDEIHLDVGEHVFCILLGNGLESGVVLGAIFDDANKPLVGDEDIRRVVFEDGTAVEYDRKNHLLNIDCKGDITIHADGNIRITGKMIYLN